MGVEISCYRRQVTSLIVSVKKDLTWIGMTGLGFSGPVLRSVSRQDSNGRAAGPGSLTVVSNGYLFVFRRLELAMMQYIRIHMIISTHCNHSVLLVFLITSS